MPPKTNFPSDFTTMRHSLGVGAWTTFPYNFEKMEKTSRRAKVS